MEISCQLIVDYISCITSVPSCRRSHAYVITVLVCLSLYDVLLSHHRELQAEKKRDGSLAYCCVDARATLCMGRDGSLESSASSCSCFLFLASCSAVSFISARSFSASFCTN